MDIIPFSNFHATSCADPTSSHNADGVATTRPLSSHNFNLPVMQRPIVLIFALCLILSPYSANASWWNSFTSAISSFFSPPVTCPPSGFDSVPNFDVLAYASAPWYAQQQVSEERKGSGTQVGGLGTKDGRHRCRRAPKVITFPADPTHQIEEGQC